MKDQKINYDYLNLGKEPILLLLSKLIRNDSPTKKTNRILVVNPCLIGEFAASLPAISYLIKKSPGDVDLMVSPNQVDLAKKVRGVKNVFSSESVYSRKSEKTETKNGKFPEYDQIFFMRSSMHSYSIVKKLKTNSLKTSSLVFSKYTLHLLKKMILGQYPKTWREINFEMLGEKPHTISFHDIFDFTKADFRKIERIPVMKMKGKKILIHTGEAWPMKRWNNDKWVELIKKISSYGEYKFIFIGGNSETADFDYISKRLDFKVYSLIKKINLSDLVVLMRLSDYFIGIDSGPRNIAHLADLRSVTLFGLGNVSAIYMPWNKKDIIIDKCGGTGVYQTFFYSKNNFMDKISVDDVYEAFKRLSRKK